jgi:hypothetical protein
LWSEKRFVNGKEKDYEHCIGDQRKKREGFHRCVREKRSRLRGGCRIGFFFQSGDGRGERGERREGMQMWDNGLRAVSERRDTTKAATSTAGVENLVRKKNKIPKTATTTSSIGAADTGIDTKKLTASTLSILHSDFSVVTPNKNVEQFVYV